ncbi:MAG: PPA1309 family protein [Nocardioides sp.]
MTEPGASASADPAASALIAVVREIEAHVAMAGWEQPARLYALVDTASVVAREPELAAQLGLDAQASPLTPVEQDGLPAGSALERVLEEIVWPDEVAGCAAVVERLVLPRRSRATCRRRRLPRRRTPAATPTGRRSGSSRPRRAPATGPAPCDCARTTTGPPWSTGPTWCPGCWTCCRPRWGPTRARRPARPTGRPAEAAGDRAGWGE